MSKNKKSLAETHPEVAKQWHPTKNGDLTPFKFTLGSNKKVWWKCDKGDDHEWYTIINNRTQGRGCPICSGKKVVKSNCLATINPELAKEWHPTKNGELTPHDIVINSSKKIWWKCNKGKDHEWEATLNSRTSNNRNCPICSNQKIVKSNCLATLNPELAKEWHPTKNGELTPQDVARSSNKKVWWNCDKGNDHEWEASINGRNRGNGCSICRGYTVVKSNCLAILNPELAKQWHPTKNGDLTPNDVGISSSKKVWWKCSKGDDHVWDATVRKRGELRDGRESGDGCPFCRGLKVAKSNSLPNSFPFFFFDSGKYKGIIIKLLMLQLY